MRARLVVAALISIAIPMAGFAEQDPIQVDLQRRASELLLADPETIIKIRKTIQENAAARQAPVVQDFSETFSQEVLDLEDIFEISMEPDSIAPKLSIARFQSTAVSFVDAYGNPWPIRRISSFLDGLVTIERATGEGEVEADDPQAGSFTMTALKHGVVGNITVYLKGLATPISILLEGKSGIYHRVATMRVTEVGPQTDVASTLSASGVRIGVASDVDLNNALYGVSPTGSEAMVVSGAEGKAWVKGDHLYLQTPLAVFSPQILGVSHGNGRFRAYKLPLSTAVMGTNTRGQTVTMRIGKAVGDIAKASAGGR